MTANPYESSTMGGHDAESVHSGKSQRGPLLYLAAGGLIGAAAAIPLVAAIPISADPNPIGYLVVLLGVPTGGIIFRLRSRHWEVDHSVRTRQIRASFATLLLPAAIAVITGLRAQGVGLMLVGALVSASVVVGIFVSGLRRG